MHTGEFFAEGFPDQVEQFRDAGAAEHAFRADIENAVSAMTDDEALRAFEKAVDETFGVA